MPSRSPAQRPSVPLKAALRRRTDDRSADRVGRGNRNPEEGRTEQYYGGAGFSTESLVGNKLHNARANRVYDPPAVSEAAKVHRGLADEDDPKQYVAGTAHALTLQ